MFKLREKIKDQWIKRVSRFEKKNPNLHLILLGLAVVAFWRAVWNLMDAYLFPSNHLLSNLICLALALGYFYLDDFRVDEVK
jgi:hypothetical protein